MPDVVVVKNLSDKDFEGKYNSRAFTIPAHGEALLDTEAACVWFGAWEARNVGPNPRNHYRAQEYDRIRALYGAHFDDRLTDEGWVIDKALKADEKWELNQPHVEIYEDGEKVVSIIDDPEGKGLPIADTPTEDLSRVIAAQQEQLDRMQEALDEMRSVKMEAPVDSPDRAPKRMRKPITAEPVREEADA